MRLGLFRVSLFMRLGLFRVVHVAPLVNPTQQLGVRGGVVGVVSLVGVVAWLAG